MKPRIRVLVVILLGVMPILGFAQGELPSSIGAVEMGAGRLFVDRDGFTLYTYKRDGEQPGVSVCVDECAKTWPPVIASDDAASPVGDWSVITRPDGSKQWAYYAAPVYRYARDTHPGAIAGDSASRFWDVLFEPTKTPPGLRIHASEVGQVLVDVDDRPVYTNASCDGGCRAGWLPVEAPWLARPLNADWKLLPGDDGLTQWAYRDQPLFVAALDTDLAAAVQQGWQSVILQPTPGLPDWVTFQEADFGPVLADADRMTLYYQSSDPDKVKKETCDAQCQKDNWEPVVAPVGTQPVGNWSTVPLDDGTLQWAYKGHGVYRFKHDKIPGDILGDKFATGAGIRDGWRALLKESLKQNLL